jgi:hypothetical protein
VSVAVGTTNSGTCSRDRSSASLTSSNGSVSKPRALRMGPRLSLSMSIAVRQLLRASGWDTHGTRKDTKTGKVWDSSSQLRST